LPIAFFKLNVGYVQLYKQGSAFFYTIN
jgi:hypothetical protein